MRGLLGLLIHQSFVTANHGDVRERQNNTVGDRSRAAHLIAECVLFVSYVSASNVWFASTRSSGRSGRSVAAIEKHCS
jgi:hypothetical protein